MKLICLFIQKRWLKRIMARENEQYKKESSEEPDKDRA